MGVIAELAVASALGALLLAIAIGIRRSLGQGQGPGLKRAMAVPARRLRKVLRRPAAGTDRPRVVVQGPKVKPVVCQICLGRVKEGMEYARCHCGKVFHPVCLSRTGFCPYCDRDYRAELPADLLVRPRVSVEQAARRTAEVRMLWEPSRPRACPICGQELGPGAAECDCGAIIIDEGEAFACPSCGTEVPPEMMQCPGCRERFDALERPLCPICGRVVMSEDGVCECGGLAGDECPECGAPLGPEDAECPGCGTCFELV
jgi:hypothetical protein